jgi:GcrA cell cycle regulator
MLFTAPPIRLDRRNRYTSPWTPERTNRLIDLFDVHPPLTCQAMADALGMEYDAVRTKLNRLNLRRYRPDDRWPPEREGELRRRHSAGEPFSDIAVALGTTRNAVIGKAQRLGLPPRLQGLREGATIRRIRKMAARDPKPPRMPVQRFIPAAPADAPEPKNFSLLDLPAGACKWSANDGQPEYLFCGHPAPRDVVPCYCPFHYRLAHKRAADRVAAREQIR